MPNAAIWLFNFIPRQQPGHFPRSCRHFEKSCDKISQPDWLTLVAIRSDERKKKSRERAHLANAGEFNKLSGGKTAFRCTPALSSRFPK